MGDLRSTMYGLAVGDALGVPFEFQGRESFTCTDMVGFGTHEKPAGTFSDDSSMALAICDSLRERGCVDCDDIRARFQDWYSHGAYTVDGMFDIGITVATALNEGRGADGEQSNGNGSLMRTAPLAFFDATDEEVAAVSAITHGHTWSTTACVKAVHLIRLLADGIAPLEAIAKCGPWEEPYQRVPFVHTLTESDISSTGFVVHTMEAALWCLTTASSYTDCVLAAVNLGSDTDTTAAVAGAFAGAYYGMEGIPASWLETLRGRDIIEGCLF